jgi:hypothetical protein
MEDCRQTDASVVRDCFKSGSQDHHERISLYCPLKHFRRSPPTDHHGLATRGQRVTGQPLQRLKAITVETARRAPALPPSPPSNALLRDTAREEAIAGRRERCMEVPRHHPAYLALTSPPDGSLPPFINGISKFPVANGDHKHQTPYRTCIHRRVHCPFPPCSLDTRTPPNGAPRHRNMPTPRRFQERLPPASLKPAIDLSHFWHEGKGLCAGAYPCGVPSLLKT